MKTYFEKIRGTVAHVLFATAVLGGLIAGIGWAAIFQGLPGWDTFGMGLGVMSVSLVFYAKTWVDLAFPEGFDRGFRVLAAISLALFLGGAIANADFLSIVAAAMLLSAVFTRSMYD